MATITDLVRQINQRPFARVRINKRDVLPVTSVRVEMGYDMAAPSASFTVAQIDAPFWTEEDDVRIDMGYVGPGGIVLPVFGGLIETDARKYAPRMLDVSASGYSKKLQRPYGNVAVAELTGSAPAFSYSSQTDTQIWNDLMRRAGVPTYSAGDGDSITYATQQAYEVSAGTKLGDIISKLDESSKSGQRTFEIAGIVIRKNVLGVPSLAVAWRYAEGVQGLNDPYMPIIDITRNVSDKDIQNQAVVKGVGVASETDETASPIMASVQAVNDKLGKDGDGNDIYVPHTLSSDFLETRDQCTDVARRYMIEFNKVTDDLTLKVALNPAIFPGQSIGITSAKMDINNERPFWVRHVSHDVGDGGAFTTLQLEGGAGPEGYLIGLAPIAAFEMFMSAEAFEVGGVLDMWYTVTCDASSSFDADGPIASYAWTSTNGDSGSGVTWSTSFSQAQWDDPETLITLTVTDSDTDPTGPHTNTLELSPTGALSEDVQVDGIYVAANGQADATADGGLTWGTWIPDGGAHVISVTRLCPGMAYYGLDDGRLVLTEDHLASEPILAHTFTGRQITAVWISEVNNLIVVVGLDNGDIWMTYDGFATVPLLKRNFSWPINWIVGSIESITQWRVATGSYVWVTYDDFVNMGTLATQSNVVQQVELSNFANYNVENVDALVKVEVVGNAVSWPAVTPVPVTARLAHFLRTDELMAADDQGRAYVKAPDEYVFTRVTDVGGGTVHGLISGRTNPKAFYAAAVDGLYKTFDAGLTWQRVRSYTAAGLDGLQLGLDSEPVAIRLIAGLQEVVSISRHPPGIIGPDWVGGQLIASTIEDGTEWTLAKAIQNEWGVGDSQRIDHTVPNPPESTHPDFWTLAYDDSAWEPLDLSWGGNSFEILPRAWIVGPQLESDNILQQDSYLMYRHVAPIPATLEPYQKAVITAFGWKQIEKLWFNGTQIHGQGSGRPEFSSHHPTPILPNQRDVDGVYHFDVTDLLVAGDDNIIAGYITSRATGTVGGVLAYRLAYNTALTLSVATVGPAQMFFTSIEESRGYDLVDPSELAAWPSGHAGTIYLRPAPDGWTNQSFSDTSWSRPVAPRRFNALVPNDNDDLRISLLNGSAWIGTNFAYPAHRGIGCGSAIRQHWDIPEGEYISAKLHLRWKHTIKVWLNGTLVHQDNSDTSPPNPPSGLETGLVSEMLDIDVLLNILPGEDNVLCIEVLRPDVYPAGWGPGDWVGACALLELQ